MTVKSTTSPIKFSNGRFVRNVIEKSIRAQAMRLLMGDQYLKNDLMTIKSQDLLIKDEARLTNRPLSRFEGLFLFLSLKPAGCVVYALRVWYDSTTAQYDTERNIHLNEQEGKKKRSFWSAASFRT